MRFIRLLHCAITLLPILHMLPNGLTAPPLYAPPAARHGQPHQFAHRLERPQHRIVPAPVHIIVFQRQGASRLRRRLSVHLALRLANCHGRREGGGEYRERGHHRDFADDPVEGRYGVEEGELDSGGGGGGAEGREGRREWEDGRVPSSLIRVAAYDATR